MDTERIDPMIDKFWPVIAPWSVVSDEWLNTLEEKKSTILSQEQLAYIWIETVIYGMILSESRMEDVLNSEEIEYFEKSIIAKIVEMSGKYDYVNKFPDKLVNLLFSDLQKRKQLIYSRFREMGPDALSGNYFGLLKNSVGDIIPDEFIAEYVDFKTKLFYKLSVTSV